MKVTAIKAQTKQAGRVSIYADGMYVCSLSHNQLLEQKLHTGLELASNRITELKRLSEIGKLYERLFRYVTLRPRSQKEIEEYCRRKGYASDQVEACVGKLQAGGYLNDWRFAQAWIEDRRLNKMASERRLRLELKQKGVADAVVEKALQEGYDERSALLSLIIKKRRMSRYHDELKLMQYLIRQGFAYDKVRSVLLETKHTDEE